SHPIKVDRSGLDSCGEGDDHRDDDRAEGRKPEENEDDRRHGHQAKREPDRLVCSAADLVPPESPTNRRSCCPTHRRSFLHPAAFSERYALLALRTGGDRDVQSEPLIAVKLRILVAVLLGLFASVVYRELTT